jgi:CRISPR-associated protein Cas1
LHQINYNRPSLALDLMEEFRPIIVDSVVLRCLNNSIIKPEHFAPGEDEARPLVLSREGIQLFIRELESRLTQEFQHPQSNERITYRRLFLLQAYALAACVKLDAADRTYQPFLVR